MKKSILKLTAVAFSLICIIASCSTPAEKVEKAETKVTEANNNLDSAIKNYQTDISSYRIEIANRIATNEKSIADFNLKTSKDKKEARTDYLKKIAVLEKKNAELKKKLDDYKDNGDDKWKIFKMEFNKEMDELGKSIKDLTSKN
jgi:TolA-binding protein